MPMQYLDENMLALLLLSGSIQHIELRGAGKGIGIFCSIKTVTDDAAVTGMLITNRMKYQAEKTPRVFKGVDSCIEFLKSKAAVLPEIKVLFNKGETTTKTETK